MRVIELTQGRVAVVDDEDFNEVAQYRWKVNNKGYAVRNRKVHGKTYLQIMHRVIMGAPKGTQVDHINGDKLDNRRSNLRLCSQEENQQNRGRNQNNKSGYKGVSWSKKEKKWIGQIMARGKHHRLGAFKTPEEAAAAYNAAATRLHGEFSNINLNIPSYGSTN